MGITSLIPLSHFLRGHFAHFNKEAAASTTAQGNRPLLG